jgi:glutathione S-transferase
VSPSTEVFTCRLRAREPSVLLTVLSRRCATIIIFCCYSEGVEALGWYQREDKDHATGNAHEWYYHWKAEELTRTNPSGLVPTLLPFDAALGAYDESKAVYESLVVIDYVDAVSGATGTDRLVPVEDPYQTARCRIWADKVNRECCSPY